MSLLADIYISRDEEAVKYDTTPGQFAERAQHKGFTPLELSMLWSIICGVEWNVALMDEFPCLLQIDEGERLIHRLPPAMVTELTNLSPDRVATVTSAWASTEELSCNSEDIRPVVDNLVRLAHRATATSRSLHLWNCV